MEKKLQSKLAKYGVLASAIAGVTDAQAGVVYTDENPDFAGAVGSQYFLDLNNDGTDEFRIWHNGSSNLYISPLGALNNVLGSGGATFAYPFALTSGTAISASAGTFFNNGFSGGFQSLNYGSCSFGNFCSVTDTYIGLQFDIGGNTHYGWVRLDVNASGSVWSVKDYAYEDVANAAINAGAMGVVPVLADTALTIVGMDIANSGNGLDLQVDYTAAVDETTISEYRVIVVKTDSTPTFLLANAQALVAANYTAITPNASPNYTQILSVTSTDADGDLIITGQSYTIFVLSVADGVNANTDALTNSLTTVTLNTPADTALSIVGTDISNNSNGTDLQVDFDAAVNEATVLEYRAIAVKDASAASFDTTAANGLATTAYVTVTPNGGPYTFPFTALTTDSDGDLITIGEPYTIFVLSIADSINANMNTLTSSVANVTLNTTANAASNVVGSDISDNGDGTDLQVDFNAAADESLMTEYRVMIVKDANASSFDLATSQAVGSTDYTVVTPAGSATYTQVLSATSTDVDGDAIAENVQYQAFIFSTSNNTTANIDSLSAGSPTFELQSSVGINEHALKGIIAFSNDVGIVIEVPTNLLKNNVEFTLYSIDGKLVKNSQLLKATRTIVSTDNLTDGIYLLRLRDNSGNTTSIKVNN